MIIGAGAAGLFCAAQAAQRGRKTVVIDHAKRIGGKILMSGGGRCNFTNMYASAEKFLSNNPHFCKSALSRYTAWDFIALVEKHGIAYHEKTLGQLFCNDSAKQIVELLLTECAEAGAVVSPKTDVLSVSKTASGFSLATNTGTLQCESLVVATGGLSMPKLGATPLGYKIAEQFGIPMIPVRAGLVPFTLHEKDKTLLAELSGVSVDAAARYHDTTFNESILFTHRGLSGPAILQISSYWEPGEEVSLNLASQFDLASFLTNKSKENRDSLLSTALAERYPKRFVLTMLAVMEIENKALKQYTHAEIDAVIAHFTDWRIKPNGTEGYRTAEVTLGGVDTHYLSSKTMQAKGVEGLYFIGEVMDVTGWLGGYNFQWAWSSGWVCGQVC
ncbi:BaiN/RdsA family NAD(P)/FAD-dependent oxidoreductase [Alteromonas oceanisediminis]|uniref:NAD(P)/FAD-dependent oxidoreductase n=1 Tax=Alteromonas oceanisediminis TaxID=2836180 RepID=UPI0028F42F80|nr:NAD(P)/FAD-dependent oxidoreductase [Alteromonas oceanisediminis]